MLGMIKCFLCFHHQFPSAHLYILFPRILYIKAHLEAYWIPFAMLLHGSQLPRSHGQGSPFVANWRKFTSLATISPIVPSYWYVLPKCIPEILIWTRDSALYDIHTYIYMCVCVYIYTGRTGGVYRSDRAFMKASWDKTPKGVPTPEGDDVLALKLLIVSWEYERDGRWKATRLQRWFVEVHWFKAFCIIGQLLLREFICTLYRYVGSLYRCSPTRCGFQFDSRSGYFRVETEDARLIWIYRMLNLNLAFWNVNGVSGGVKCDLCH